MPTFLTTPRMPPALKARIERSVSRRARARHHAQQAALGAVFNAPARTGPARIIAIAAITLVALLFGWMQRHESRTIEDQRNAVLTSLDAHRLGWSERDEEHLAAIDKWLIELSSEHYAGDLVAPELGVPGELDTWLTRSAVYLRGATPELGEASKHAEAAARSTKDAFLLCLVEPPPSRSEADILAKVRGVNFGGAIVDDQTANVRRLHEARLGFAVLAPAFESEVRTTTTVATLLKLGKDLEAAPIRAARDVAAAELLIVVADELGTMAGADKPGADRPGRNEQSLGQRVLDHPHDARVALIDLNRGTVLLRARHHMDVSARSKNARTLYGAAMMGCELAVDTRRSAEE